MERVCNDTFFLARPLGPWGGAKRSNIIKYLKISITKSISKIYKPNFVCLLTNERYKTYQTGFSFIRGGAKRSNIIKSQSQSQFQRFFNQTLFVFSQLKDMKHIRRDFHSVAWVMPQGWDLGVPWGLGVQKLFFPNSTRFGV